MKNNFFNIENEDRKSLLELKNVILVIMILIDLSFIFIITFFNVSFDDLFFMACFDLLVCFILFIDLIFKYVNYNKGFKSFIKEHIIDILSIIPYNFIFLRYLAIYRIFRIFQIVQIFKLYSVRETTDGSFKYFIRNRLLKIWSIIVVIYVIISVYVLTQLDSSFTSIFDALWYNVVSITSVGYGDITPLTYSGKIIGMLTIIMGILFVSIFTAAMSSIYVEGHEEQTRRNIKLEFDKLENENNKLHEKIDNLEKENKVLNDKLDNVINLLKDDD